VWHYDGLQNGAQVNNTLSRNIKKLNKKKYMTITVLAAHKDGKFTFSGLHQDLLIYRSETGRIETYHTEITFPVKSVADIWLVLRFDANTNMNFIENKIQYKGDFQKIRFWRQPLWELQEKTQFLIVLTGKIEFFELPIT
jgi:hypothetical protein